jgi:hypothetical protein
MKRKVDEADYILVKGVADGISKALIAMQCGLVIFAGLVMIIAGIFDPATPNWIFLFGLGFILFGWLGMRLVK